MSVKIILLQKLGIFIGILISSIIILKFLDTLIFNKYLQKKVNIHIPSLYRDILIFILLAIIVVTALRIEFGLKLTGILTSSAILSIIIGLALQDTLSNLIGGIVLHIEKPFKIGDWIKIGSLEGEIIEINWRATRLKTMDGNYIIIPNTNISKETILNYYEPTRAHAITFQIGLEYHVSPNLVKEVILKSISDCADILKEPPPIVYISNFGEYAIEYEIKFWIDNHSLFKNIKDSLMTKIWYNLKRNNIQIPFPIKTLYIQKKEEVSSDTSKNVGMIKNIEIFQDLSEEEIYQIAQNSKIKHFTKGERIIIQGEEGDSLYMLTKGSVRVIKDEVHIGGLKRGNYFGEMSLLTGERRSATVIADDEVEVIEINSNSLLPIIRKNPQIMEKITKRLIDRERDTSKTLEKAEHKEPVEEREHLFRNLVNKIRGFFKVKESQ